MTVYCVYCGNAIESEARLTYRPNDRVGAEQGRGWSECPRAP